MYSKEANAFLHEEWKQKNKITESEDMQVDDADFLSAELEFFALNIAKLEKEHRATENWGLPCIHCQGTGSVSYTDNGAPHGAGFWPMQVEDVCGYCADNGICPKCAGQLEDHDGEFALVCESCGYNASEDTGGVEICQV